MAAKLVTGVIAIGVLCLGVAHGSNLAEGCPLNLRGGCGFLGIYGSVLDPIALRMKTLKLQRLIRHRGPDGSGIHVIKAKEDGRSHAVAHERLAIVGVMDDPGVKSELKSDQHPHLHTLSGNQPLYSFDGTKSLSVNGEIYNYKALQKLVKSKQEFRTASDCEVIVHLYDEVGERVAEMLDGDFAFVIMDEKNSEIFAARDPMGVNSMYIGWASDGSVWFSSEMKCLLGDCSRVEQFPPGNYWSSKTRSFTQYYKPAWISFASAQNKLDFTALREKCDSAAPPHAAGRDARTLLSLQHPFLLVFSVRVQHIGLGSALVPCASSLRQPPALQSPHTPDPPRI
jgi:asparagine synthase (glutamine-hydrolysing)